MLQLHAFRRIGVLGLVTLATVLACGSPDGLDFGNDGSGATGAGANGGNGGQASGCEVTGCPAGEFCEPTLGCQPTVDCGSDADCLRAFGSDPCKNDVACDELAGQCTYAVTDADGDDHAPVECGGDDCDDEDPDVAPGVPDACDGANNDCDNEIDEDASCSGLLQCEGGTCVCPAQNTCGAACVDKSSDPSHCGECNVLCPAGSSCTGGDCECNGGLTECGAACVNTMSDPLHCGGCNQPCSDCNNGECACGGDLYILLDLSGSMAAGPFGAAASRLEAAREAIQAFNLTATNGNYGIGYFPKTFVPPPTCVVNRDCGGGGLCFNGLCLSGGGDSCDPTDYVASVALAALPGSASAVSTNLDAQVETGGTPTGPALQGALTYVESVATGPSAVVLITDGTPNTCTPVTASGVAQIASTFAAGNPAVLTYVIGLQNADTPNADYHTMAQGGGTSTAFIATNQAGIQSALATIKTNLTGCL